MSQGLADEKSTLKSSCSDMELSEVLPHLYLGCQDNALSIETMINNGITHVINVSQSGEKAKFLKEDDEHFLRIPVDDCHTAQLLPYFDQSYDFIETARCKGGRVFIHCLAGISRSPSLAIAYIMRYLNLSVDEAYQYVKQRRPKISPNFNFLGQLYQYEHNLALMPKATLNIIYPLVQCCIPDMCLNDCRYFVPLECASNRNNSIQQSKNVSSSPTCFKYDLINTSKQKSVLPSSQTMTSLAVEPSEEQTLISRKPSRPTSISIEFSTLIPGHSTSHLSNRTSPLRNNKKTEPMPANDNGLSSVNEIDLVNTYFQDSSVLFNPLAKWEAL